MHRFINRLHRSPGLGRFFHTVTACLAEELADCESVLDLGCGPNSPLQYCPRVPYSVGVDAFPPYVEASRRRRIHTEYRLAPIESVAFPPKSFDAVMLIEVLEHLPTALGHTILERAEQWARKKVVVTTPNGFLPQHALDENPYQAHRSGWDLPTLRSRGYTCRGLAGLKYLRTPARHDTMEVDLLGSIRFRPSQLWFAVAAASQLLTHRTFPQYAFELFGVKALTDRGAT